MSNAPPADRSASRRIGPKRSRDLQRIAHLAIGAAVLLHLYFTPGPGSAVETTVRWLLAPVLVGSGLAMWQWPRLRRRLRRRKAAA